MAQTTILAPGNTEDESSEVVVGTTPVTIAIYAPTPSEPEPEPEPEEEGEAEEPVAPKLPTGVTFVIVQKTPGYPNKVATLNNERRSYVLTGPGTYAVLRPAYDGADFGVFSEDGVDEGGNV